MAEKRKKKNTFCRYLIVLVVLIKAISSIESKSKSISICSFSSFIFELGTLNEKNTDKDYSCKYTNKRLIEQLYSCKTIEIAN